MVKSNKQKILVPIDFLELSKAVLYHSQKLAIHIGAEITLLNILEVTGKEGKKEEVIQIRLQEFAAANGFLLPFKKLIRSGVVHNQIIESSKLVKSNFIVMGANRQKKNDKYNYSGEALKVIRESTIPVITVNSDFYKEKFENIILPLDLSTVTTQKVSKTIELAKMGKGAVINIISVVFNLDDYIINKLAKQMQVVKQLIREAGIQCTAEIIKANKEEESLVDVILDYTRRYDGDLIVIMTSQDKASKKKNIDNEALEIIMTSEIPVLSVTPN